MRLTDNPHAPWEEDPHEEKAARERVGALGIRPVERVSKGSGGKCPKCDAALSSDCGRRLDGTVIPLEQRSRAFGEPREAFVAEVPPTLRPTADEAPAELLREWHRIQQDNWLFKAGDFRCADKAACERRYRAGEDVEP